MQLLNLDSDQQKLRHLLSRVKAPFVSGVVASIHVRLNHHGEIVPYTYADALSAIRTAVNEQHPPTFNSNNNTRRHIRAANARTHGGGGRGGRGGGGRGYGGYGRGFGRGGRGGNRHEITRYFHTRDSVTSNRNGSTPEKLTNGKWIEYHASYQYSNQLFNLFPDDLKEKMRNERRAYRNNNSQRGNDNRTIQELRSEIDEMRSTITSNNQNNTTAPPIGQVDTDVQSRISQVSQATDSASIMGGRQQRQQQRDNTPVPPGGLATKP